MLCSIIIPVHNKWQLTADCLQSLAQYTPLDSVEVILVDNGSSDETSMAAKSLGARLFNERFTYIRRDTETHFAAGCNHGARVAKGKFLFFLNNDTLLTEDWFPPLLEPFSLYANVGATGPILLYGDEEGLKGRVQHLGIAYSLEVRPLHLYNYFPADHPVTMKQRQFQGLTGAALMVPKYLFEEAGMFYEEYINGFEDVELTALLAVNSYKLFSVPKSRFYHLEGQSEGRHDKEMHNSVLFYNRVQQHVRGDLHNFLHDDGYMPSLGEWGRMEIHLPEERRQEFANRYIAEPTIENSIQLLHEEPVWSEGYDLLIKLAVQDKNYTLALHYAIYQTYFFFNTEAMELLLAVSSMAYNSELAMKASKTLLNERSEEVKLRRFNEYICYLEKYRSEDDRQAAKYFKDWFVKYGKSK